MAATLTKPVNIMEELLANAPDIIAPKPGTLVDGKVVSIYKNKILVDINGFMTGLISGREARDSLDTLKKIKIGDNITAYVIDEEDAEGYIVLSLRKASQERTWKRFEEAFERGDVITVNANEANKGGLLLEIDGIKGFIPVSQLAPLHYPRVNGADANMILQRLQALVGTKFLVKIINIDKENGKLILSEKAAMEEQRKVALTSLKVGQKVKGKISGIVKFGIFVAFDGLEGLVHISEIAWGHVKDPADYGKLGNDVEVLVIGIEGEKISLSMKRLVEDPWLEAAKAFKLGDVVDGEINRLTPFGAFIKLGDEINGLIHLTEISAEPIKDPSEVLKLGDKVKAKIIAIEPTEHRIGLSIKALSEEPKKKIKKEAEEEAKAEEEEKAKKKPKKAEKVEKEEPKEEAAAEEGEAKKSKKKA
jgi:small subunit ribosomal protein S1